MSHESSPRRAVDALVAFARDLPADALPDSVVEKADGIILDTLGAAIQAASPRYSAGRIITELARVQGGTPESSVIGAGFRTSCVQAALVNATLGYYCDVEPHHPRAIMHGAAIVVPTALAVGEREHVGGAELRAAVVVGIGVACRVANAIDATAIYRRGMHPTAVAGVFGAAAAAGRLLRLDTERFRHALGLAGTQASGLLAWETDPTEHSRPFNPGIAARNGTTAALLASLGFGGPPDVFEGRFNVLGAFAERQPDGSLGHLAELTTALGQEFAIAELAIKLYSCCAFLHPGLDALLQIVMENELSPDDVKAVTLRFPTNGVKLIDNNELKSHCAQYILPIAMVDRRVTIDDILHDRRDDPTIAKLSRRVRVVASDELDRTFPAQYSSIVDVATTDGRHLSRRVDFARGCPENPVAYAEIAEKFASLTVPTIGALRSARIAELVSSLDSIDDVGVLAAAVGEPVS